MLEPSIDSLMEKVDSKYTLVVLAAKRARQLQERTAHQPGSSTTRNVSRALWEIEEGKIKYVRTREGIK
ncbi:DNA-directed RNA polymerase subunit omega [Alicyclobacillus cellulosilyticus]|uniref:DNA-directed RNA polymerase subunit omega n=1 Tax=Alicyclobacillus cellulosilyticus TaxID=1003997 RepID=A0A917NFK6_9BACL|nr:DNA-directed RNA polymerase subunit omega [Alicyclobacillus cellulosilyticus]GGI97470.1 DNA-directed RNA polymerase subunit omega [Alicyclobacillus cellulosilyticus]